MHSEENDQRVFYEHIVKPQKNLTQYNTSILAQKKKFSLQTSTQKIADNFKIVCTCEKLTDYDEKKIDYFGSLRDQYEFYFEGNWHIIFDRQIDFQEKRQFVIMAIFYVKVANKYEFVPLQNRKICYFKSIKDYIEGIKDLPIPIKNNQVAFFEKLEKRLIS